MFTVTELLDHDAQKAINIPWGKGHSIAAAICNAAHAITADTEGLIDHVNNATCLALYMQSTGSKLVLAYERQYVVRYGTLGSIGAGKLGEGKTVALAMQDALRNHNDSLQGENVSWDQMVTDLLVTDYHVWVSAE